MVSKMNARAGQRVHGVEFSQACDEGGLGGHTHSEAGGGAQRVGAEPVSTLKGSRAINLALFLVLFFFTLQPTRESWQHNQIGFWLSQYFQVLSSIILDYS